MLFKQNRNREGVSVRHTVSKATPIKLANVIDVP
jgi:hypothetical protein